MAEYTDLNGTIHESYLGQIKHGYFPIKKKAKRIPFKFEYVPKKTQVTSIPLRSTYLREL